MFMLKKCLFTGLLLSMLGSASAESAQSGGAAGTLLTPLWPTQLQYIGVKFIVSGIPPAFGAGKVTVDITPHHSPDAVTNALGATIHPRVPNAGW